MLPSSDSLTSSVALQLSFSFFTPVSRLLYSSSLSPFSLGLPTSRVCASSSLCYYVSHLFSSHFLFTLTTQQRLDSSTSSVFIIVCTSLFPSSSFPSSLPLPFSSYFLALTNLPSCFPCSPCLSTFSRCFSPFSLLPSFPCFLVQSNPSSYFLLPIYSALPSCYSPSSFTSLFFPALSSN